MFIQLETVSRIKEPYRTRKKQNASDPCPECGAECI